jgi:preprotein translocase subunit SecE
LQIDPLESSIVARRLAVEQANKLIGTDCERTMKGFASTVCRDILRVWWPSRRQTAEILALAVALTCHASASIAQDDAGAAMISWPAEAAYRAATLADDLTFPVEAEPLERVTSPRMALFKPASEGPFSALVIMPQRSGLREAVMSWARKAVERHYAVLVVDSLGPRGANSVCYGPQAGVNFFRGVRDALQAAEQLRQRSFVDKNRVALIGFSWRAAVALLASSSHYVEAVKAGPPSRPSPASIRLAFVFHGETDGLHSTSSTATLDHPRLC